MPRAANTPEVLWSKVEIRSKDECWIWTGFRNAQGYGRTWINDKGYYAHRVIFNLANPGVISLGKPKDGEFIRHKCDNPPCCNPAHLETGTHLQNMRDSVERKRRPDYRGSRSPRAKLSDDEVREIRFMHRNALATRRALELLYEVSECTIKGVLSGRHYSDIE